MINVRNISDRMPLYKIGEDLVISKRADYTIGFRVELPEIFNLDEEDYEKIHTLFDTLIKRMPDYSIIHKQDYFFKKKYATKKKSGTFLGNHSEMKFLERDIVEHECYLFFTQSNSEMVDRTYQSSLINRNIVPTEAIDLNIYNEFVNTIAAFEQTLNSSNYFRVQRLNRSDYVNNEGEGLISQYLTLGKSSAISDISFQSQRVGNKKFSFYTLENIEQLTKVDYKKKLHKLNTLLSFSYPLSLGLKFDHIFNQYVFCGNHKSEILTRESSQRQMQSFAKMSSHNEVHSIQLKNFINQANNSTRIVQSHCNVLVFEENEVEFKSNCLAVDVAMQELNVAKTKNNVADIADLFWGGIPGNASDIPKALKMTLLSEQAACFFSSETSQTDSNSDWGMRLCDSSSGYPLYVDLFFEPLKKNLIHNRNAFIVGSSGAGKSFLTNLMVRYLLEGGHHVVLVDLGGSYRRLCELYGGIYISYDPENPLSHNPFILPKSCNGKIPDEKVENLISLIYTIWLDEPSTKVQDAVLKDKIVKYYSILKNKPEIFPCFNSFYEFMKAYHQNLIATEDKHKEGKYFDFDSFFLVMRQYYKGGTYEHLLNATENFDLLETQLIVYDLENIKDNQTYLSIETLMIMDTLLDKVFRLELEQPETAGTVLKSLLMEEAWKALMNPKMAEFLKYAAKTLRKHFGNLIPITQELDDLLDNKFVKSAIVGNSDIKIIMDLSGYKEKQDSVIELLGMTDRESALIKSLNQNIDASRGKYKEAFVKVGPMSKVYSVEVSDVEYATFTTSKDERIEIERLQKLKGKELGLLQFAENRKHGKLIN